MKLTDKKAERLRNLSNANHVIAALAIDQRDSFQKMLPEFQDPEQGRLIREYKTAVSRELTKYASSILLDPLYGLEAAKERAEGAGLLMAYEISGYVDDERQLRLLEGWSAQRLIAAGADAAKILLYYDVDDSEENNDRKKAVVERIGAECAAEDLPLFLELITYDRQISDAKSKEFARVKPHKVIDAVREFSKPQYRVDVLKLEVPVNMDYVEGYGEDPIFTEEEARQFFLEQSEATPLPYIFLSAGVPMDLFKRTLRLAKDAGARFNGVLCGRATWKGGVAEFVKDEAEGVKWLETTGKENITSLNEVIEQTCTPWTDRLEK